MKDLLHKTLFVSTTLLLLLILIQTGTSVFKLKPLNGVSSEAEMPKLTLKSYTDNSFQDGLNRYLRKHLGFREWMIRFYNQCLWSCFHETNNSTVMRGKGNWLFGEGRVKEHYESLMYKYTNDTAEMKRILETEALRLWKVQELLKEYNIHIFVDINPSKHVVFPEYLPENRSYFRPVGVRAYDYLKKRFDDLNVNYIDFTPVFKNLKDTVDYPLFTETGTHWSNIASWHAFDSIIKYMEHIGNQNLVNLDIYDKHYDKTRSPDNDLELVLNLIFPIKTPKNLYAVVGVKRDSLAAKPNFLTVGDSFFWNILGNVPLWEIFQSNPYWFYNSTIHGDKAHTSTSEVDFEQELMRHDYIMLIYNTVTLYEFSHKFLPRALLHLCYDKAAIDSMALNITDSISLYHPEQYREALQMAKETKQNVDVVLHKKALDLLCTEPEKYFKELEGNKLPTHRNKDLKAIRNNCTFALSNK